MSGKKAPKSRNEPVTTLYQKNQPIWKTAIIQVLRGTIGILETTVVKLETETPKDSSGKKINFLSRWDGFLRTFRLFLPSSISNNVSDSLLTGIFAVIFLVTIGITIFLFIPKSTQVAVVPPVEEVTKPTPVIEPEPKPTPVIEPEPKPTPVIEPEPTPTPIIELTPEESLLVAIENQFSEISVSVKNTKDKNKDQNIVSQLIKPLVANFRTGDLTLKISDMWYSLEKSQQDKLAADILQRSQELNFTHLKIVDSQEKMIARSPVVGNEMIIFHR
ncbi:procyclic acidic repetitive family protein [Dolichospermum circinale]|uniref:procyclic acidic repetitive family protein n=1 Tax=Dolichospermum circinale TaxID=109265 RepID=UPI00232D7F60|nr:procyclic acidic repetitive family protein [Dolichospermum circinale]MDB9473699.1 procyclic acidic repetitive family protein [Dolichospermum circinale CS-537/11]